MPGYFPGSSGGRSLERGGSGPRPPRAKPRGSKPRGVRKLDFDAMVHAAGARSGSNSMLEFSSSLQPVITLAQIAQSAAKLRAVLDNPGKHSWPRPCATSVTRLCIL